MLPAADLCWGYGLVTRGREICEDLALLKAFGCMLTAHAKMDMGKRGCFLEKRIEACR